MRIGFRGSLVWTEARRKALENKPLLLFLAVFFCLSNRKVCLFA